MNNVKEVFKELRDDERKVRLDFESTLSLSPLPFEEVKEVVKVVVNPQSKCSSLTNEEMKLYDDIMKIVDLNKHDINVITLLHLVAVAYYLLKEGRGGKDNE